MKRWFIVCMTAATLMSAMPVFADEVAPKPKQITGRIGWVMALGAVGGFELWAVKTRHETMSQGVQHSRGMKLAVGVGLGALSVHLFWK